MKRLLPTLMTLFCVSAGAQENVLKSGFNWLKSQVPQGTQLSFHKSRIKFNGCKHREYELRVDQPLSEQVSLEGGVTYAKGKLNWGIHQQKISLMRFSLVPRVTVSDDVSVGAGVVYQSAPEFRTNQGQGFDLPKSRIWLVNSRFAGLKDNHSVELELSQHRWDATNEIGGLFENGFTDNKLMLSYQVTY